MNHRLILTPFEQGLLAGALRLTQYRLGDNLQGIAKSPNAVEGFRQAIERGTLDSVDQQRMAIAVVTYSSREELLRTYPSELVTGFLGKLDPHDVATRWGARGALPLWKKPSLLADSLSALLEGPNDPNFFGLQGRRVSGLSLRSPPSRGVAAAIRGANGLLDMAAMFDDRHLFCVTHIQDLLALFSSPEATTALAWAEGCVKNAKNDPSSEIVVGELEDFGLCVWESIAREVTMPNGPDDINLEGKLAALCKVLVVYVRHLPVGETHSLRSFVSRVAGSLSETARQKLRDAYEVIFPELVDWLGEGEETELTFQGDAGLRETTPEEARLIGVVKKARFRQIETSGFFERGLFLLCIDPTGQVRPYADLRMGVDLRTVKAIAVEERQGLTWVKIVLSEEDYVFARKIGFFRSLRGDRGPLSADEVHFLTSKKTDGGFKAHLLDYLYGSGFTEDQQTPGIFRRPCFDGGYPRELLAFVCDGKLQKLALSITPPDQDLLSPTVYEVRWGSWAPEREIQRHPALLLSTDRREVAFTSHGGIGCYPVQQRPLIPLEHFSPDELGLKTPQTFQDQVTRFVVSGVNSTEIIQRLTHINGLPILELERCMRPGSSSDSGFLGSEESLLTVLARDNEAVSKMGLNHQRLAGPLFLMMAAAKLQMEGVPILYRGGRFQVTTYIHNGHQDSPFADGTKSSAVICVQNLDTGKSLSFSALLPEMIHRYGFYEGAVSYRLPPEHIIEVFDFFAS